MEYRNLRIAKALLFRLFWVQFAFLLVMWIIWLLSKDTLQVWALAQWGIHDADPAFLEKITLGFFAVGKFILYCVYLVPAIAICWTLRTLEKKSP